MYKRLNRNEPCWCGSGKKYKLCHSNMDDQIMMYQQKGYIVPTQEIIKSKVQMDGIRESGNVNTAVLDYISGYIKAGISTEDINQLVYDKTIELGGFPATLGYEDYPKSVCTSLNNEVCHGIPSSHVRLKDGDIINVDVSTKYHGYYSDASRMFCVGNVSSDRRQLIEVTRAAINVGLQQVKPWNEMGKLGQAINNFVSSHGYSVVEEIGGHGIGLEFHEEPFVSYIFSEEPSMLMVPGMVFTIEPMINVGKSEVMIDNYNGWTVYTKDGMDSAQCEVTVAVTERGYEVLSY